MENHTYIKKSFAIATGSFFAAYAGYLHKKNRINDRVHFTVKRSQFYVTLLSSICFRQTFSQEKFLTSLIIQLSKIILEGQLKVAKKLCTYLNERGLPRKFHALYEASVFILYNVVLGLLFNKPKERNMTNTILEPFITHLFMNLFFYFGKKYK